MLSYCRIVFLIALVSICFLKSSGEEMCGKKCKSLTDCPAHLVCDDGGECTNNPVVPPVRCPIKNCNPTSTFTYTNGTKSADRCQNGSVYQLFSCSPPLKKNNFALLYVIELEGNSVACNKNKSHKNSEMLVSLATGWFNKGRSCSQNIKLTNLDGSGRTAVAKVVDECGSYDGCSASTDYYEPCPPSSVGGTKAVWEALGHKAGYTDVIYISWSFSVSDEESNGHHKALVIGVSSGAAALILFALGILVVFQRRQASERRMLKAVDRRLGEESQQPQRFKYHTLHTATKGFNSESKIGESAGFGTVYQGTLSNGILIAVKQLASFNQSDKQFKTEVLSLCSLYHPSLIKLLGFCIHKRAHMLVYEHVANGSLDQWLFSRDKFLPWNMRVLIALDVARGLAYLHKDHEDQKGKVLHLDIKPQNVLLDGNMRAKIADFGFSKLISKESIQVVALSRGPKGYMAPEWLQMKVTDKTDVYSFGILLLELACGRKCMESSSKDQQDYEFLAEIAFKKLNAGMTLELVDKRMVSVAIEGFHTVLNMDVFEKVIRVGLWCVQEDPSMRPTMAEVVKALENAVNKDSMN